MNRGLLVILVIVSILSIAKASCIIHEKDDPKIHVIEVDSSSGSSSSEEPEVVAVKLDSKRRRRDIDSKKPQLSNETTNRCKKDDECNPKQVCIPYIACVKGVRKNRSLTKSPPQVARPKTATTSA